MIPQPPKKNHKETSKNKNKAIDVFLMDLILMLQETSGHFGINFSSTRIGPFILNELHSLFSFYFYVRVN